LSGAFVCSGPAHGALEKSQNSPRRDAHADPWRTNPARVPVPRSLQRRLRAASDGCPLSRRGRAGAHGLRRRLIDRAWSLSPNCRRRR
jgi:hypothetical protein